MISNYNFETAYNYSYNYNCCPADNNNHNHHKINRRRKLNSKKCSNKIKDYFNFLNRMKNSTNFSFLEHKNNIHIINLIKKYNYPLFFRRKNKAKDYLKETKYKSLQEKVDDHLGIPDAISNMHKLPYEFVKDYAEQDVNLTLKLWEIFKKKIVIL